MAPKKALFSLLLLLTASAGLCNLSEAVGANPNLPVGDIVFADPVAFYGDTTGETPAEFEFDGRGAIYRHSPSADTYTVISKGQEFVDPTSVAIEAAGTVLVVDQNWGELQSDTGGPGGAVLRVDPSQAIDSNATVLSDGNFFRDPVGITVNPSNGDIYVVDRNSTDPGLVVKIDPSTGAQTLLASDGELVNPQDIAWNRVDGMLYVVDPVENGSATGKVIRIDPATGDQTLISTGDQLIDPVGLDIAADGNLWVVDEFGGPNNLGTVLHVNATTGAQTVLTAEANFEHPHDVALEAGGSLVVTDPVAGLGNGLLARVSSATGAQTVLSYGADTADDYVEPLGVVVVKAFPPQVQSDKTVTVLEDSLNEPLNITAPSDPDGEELTIEVDAVPDPAKGTVHLMGGGAVTAGQTLTEAQLLGLLFDTVPNANGAAGTFAYTVTAGTDSSSQVVTIAITAVNDPPVANPQMVSLQEDGSLAITLTATDVDSPSLTYEVVDLPDHGALTGTAPNLTYTPTLDYHGPDSFTFRAFDGMDYSNVATISITVIPNNVAPVAQADKTVTVLEDAAATSLAITAPTDEDEDPLVITITAIPDPTKGEVINAGGTAYAVGNTLTGPQLAAARFRPRLNANGSAGTFAYTVDDGNGGTDSQIVTLEITPVNDLPVAVGETYGTRRGTTLEVAAPGVLNNDTDVESATLTAQLVSGPAGAKTFTFNANGSFQYTPRIGFTGADTFTYRAYDGTEAGNTVTVTINVSPEPPDSTPNGKADAVGTLAVTGGTGSFNLSARKTGGIVMGSFTYTDPDRARTVSSTQLTSVVITGRQARVFGKGKLPSGVVVDFVVDVNDIAEPGRLKDTFQLEISTGPIIGGVLTTGNVSINR